MLIIRGNELNVFMRESQQSRIIGGCQSYMSHANVSKCMHQRRCDLTQSCDQFNGRKKSQPWKKL